MAKVLVIDDDPGLCRAIKRTLEMKGHIVEAWVWPTVTLPSQCSKEIPWQARYPGFDAIVCDYELRDAWTGLDVLMRFNCLDVRILYTGAPELAQADLDSRPEPELFGIKIVPKESDVSEALDISLRQR